VAAVATFVEDLAANGRPSTTIATHPPRQIRADGSAPREEVRTRSLSYSAFNLEAFAMLCRIAQAHGTDLWTVSARNGATIATVIDYLERISPIPAVGARNKCRISERRVVLSGFAGMGLKKPEYVALFRNWNIPRRLAQLRGPHDRPLGSRRPPDPALKRDRRI